MSTRFVGRDSELATFRRLLAEPGGSAIFVDGPGGIGKSALLGQFAAAGRAAGLAVLDVDLTGAESSRNLLREVIADEMTGVSRYLLLVDDCPWPEAFAEWLRRYWRADLPLTTIVVAASRAPISVTARTALGWVGPVKTLRLEPLAGADARLLLGPDREDADRLVALVEGNPFGLTALAAVASPPLRVEDDLELVHLLMDGMVEPVPGPRHRRALQTAAHAGHTTESLLAAVLDGDVHELFEWLRRSPIVTESPLGLVPDPLVRELVDADFRWRDELGYADVHRRATDHLLTRVAAHLHDLDAVLRDAAEVLVLNRHRLPYPAELGGAVDRTEHTSKELDAAPEPIAEHVRTNGLLRQGHGIAVTLVSDTAGAAKAMVIGAFHAYTEGSTAWDFVLVPNGAEYPALLALADLHHVGPVQIDSSWFQIYAHDWRRLSPWAWLRKIAVQAWDAPIPPTTGVEARVLSDEAEFARAVHDALRHLTSERRLSDNPLIDSRIVRESLPGLTPVQRLRTLIQAAADPLRVSEAALYRIIDRVYLRPTATQQQIADSMNLPLTTFRRWRNKAVARIADRLWDQEIGFDAL